MKLPYKPHPIYSKKPSEVYIVHQKNKRRCLDAAIRASNFISHLNSNWENTGKQKSDFTVAIKPNFMCAAFESDISVYTDVELVEHLIEIIRHEGYSNVKVVESQMVWSDFYHCRTVKEVADLLGYSGDGYEIVDLTLEREEYNYGDPALGWDWYGPTWGKANYRISFAKNKTHFQSLYTGCMKNVYGCLPVQDKLKHYHENRHRFYGSAVAILVAFPVHFCFIDAYFSSDGCAGMMRDNNPNDTNTIICGENSLAVDWVQGEKMGVNPLKNPVVSKAVQSWGNPEIQRIGPMDKYKHWNNILPGVTPAASIVQQYYNLSKIFLLLTGAYRMDDRFKMKNDWTCKVTWLPRNLIKFIDSHMCGSFLSALVIAIFFFLLWIGRVTLPSQKLELLNPIRFGIALSIFIGGIMHLMGLIKALRNKWSLPKICWFFFFFAIVAYPVCAVMILKSMRLAYWITLVAPCVGGLFIFIGFFRPESRFLMLLAGTYEREITWMGFLQVTSESLAVAGAAIMLYVIH